MAFRRSSLQLVWALFLVASAIALPAASAAKGNQAAKAAPGYKFRRGGWTYVHLEGSPAQIGFQHGQLLAADIEDMLGVLKVETQHETHRDWAFFREAARTQLWPHIDADYREELAGIAKGAQAAGVKIDVWDVVALNGGIELPQYYVPWLNKHEHALNAPHILPEGRCSAFIATGSYTHDGKIIIAHNNWSSYAEGARWTVVFDIQPQHGHRIVMDGAPGLIASQDDFGINDAGILSTETTITQFAGWDPKGKPEFMRARKALQYAGSIDEYVAIIKDGDNGGYANDWLIGDRNTGEIAYLELGLKNAPLWRSKDGYFVSSNFARDASLIKDETEGFDPANLSSSPNARRITWEKEMAAQKGKIDIATAERLLGDHKDSYAGNEQADERSLCGHVDTVSRGVPEWEWPAYYPGGAVTGKVADADMAAGMAFMARAGHPCGEDFHAASFLSAHPEYDYLKPILKDMPAGPWSRFSAGETR